MKNLKAHSFKLNYFFSVLIIVTVIVLSCENQQVEKPIDDLQIQREILHDEVFVNMMTNVFVARISGVYSSPGSEAWNQHLKDFKSYSNLLNERYLNFNTNAQKALDNTKDIAYNTFLHALNEQLLIKLSSPNGKEVEWDGDSICGLPCGNHTASANACLAGCFYSSAYCSSNGGTNCTAMLESCKASCCSAFCTGPLND